MSIQRMNYDFDTLSTDVKDEYWHLDTPFCFYDHLYSQRQHSAINIPCRTTCMEYSKTTIFTLSRNKADNKQIINKLQEVTFYNVKDYLLRCKRKPFASRFAAFCKTAVKKHTGHYGKFISLLYENIPVSPHT